MGQHFFVFDGHIINISQIAHVSDINGEDAVHIDMIGGGFHRIPAMSVENFAERLQAIDAVG